MKLDIRSTGSPAGMSSTLTVAQCERKLCLDNARPKKDPPDLPTEAEKPNALLVGSGIHAGLAGWYLGRYDTEDTKDDIQWYGASIEDSHPANCAEIRRMLRWYFRQHTPDEFGRVLEVEQEVARPLDDPELPGFTGALDLVAACTEFDVGRLGALGCYLPGPGRYLVDHKSAAQADRNAQREYELRPQFSGYMMLGHDLQGCIINRIMKTREPKRALYFVPPPDEHAKLMVRALVGRRLQALQGGPESARPNPDACVDRYGGVCQHLRKTCNRY